MGARLRRTKRRCQERPHKVASDLREGSSLNKPMSDFTIRACTRADLDAVEALLCALLPYDMPHNDPARSVARKMDFDDGLFFVALPSLNCATKP